MSGDTVAVIAPAGPFDRASFDAGAAILGERYQLQYDSGIFERYRYLAGDDSRRLAEITRALTDPAIRAVFCARGGYGAMRLLESLDTATGVTAGAATADVATAAQSSREAQQARDTGAAIVGFSDITALHQWRQRQGQIPDVL